MSRRFLPGFGFHFVLAALLAGPLCLPATALDVVTEGRAVATIVVRGATALPAGKPKRGASPPTSVRRACWSIGSRR